MLHLRGKTLSENISAYGSKVDDDPRILGKSIRFQVYSKFGSRMDNELIVVDN